MSLPKELNDKFLTGAEELLLSDSTISSVVSFWASRGKLVKIGPKLYTVNTKDSPEAIIQRNRWQLVNAFFPGALIADRTALENKPSADGSIFVIYLDRTNDLILPGLRVRPRPGHPPLENDVPFVSGLKLCSTGRALLENLVPSRKRGGVARTLNRRELELWLEEKLRIGGRDFLNKIRDEARLVAQQLGLPEQMQELDRIVGALQGTRGYEFSTPSGKAWNQGTPYDSARIELFDQLRDDLLREAPATFPEDPSQSDRRFLPFFEAYFSNFIEGTEFEVSVAREIVYEGLIPEARPEDAHDILSTFRVVSNSQEMMVVPASFEELIQLLRTRHATIMAQRKSFQPGEFKQKSNKAGDTVFVDPDLVQGTLRRGFDNLAALRNPLQRAVYMHFLISEVHPFRDGNGRIARIMMNAELVHAGQSRIIIPTVARAEYLGSLNALSHNKRSEATIQVLRFFQRFTAEIDFSDFNRAEAILRDCNAFVDSARSVNEGITARLPRKMTA